MYALKEQPASNATLDTVGAARLPVTFASGEGALLFDRSGRRYWDFYGGHAVALLGQGHPAWVEALTEQAKRLSFVTTIAPLAVREQAAQALCCFTGMDRAWFINSGAEANEAALKMARKATGRSVIVAMEGGFHGRTMGALGVSWRYREQHQPPHGDVRFVPYGDLAALEAALGPDVAAVICEPIQGLAGVVEPPAGWLAGVQRVARAAGALLICDEVQSGVGRTGTPLACHREGVLPDLVTVGKGLGGGFPVAAVLLKEAVAATVSPGEHGSTFGGGPLAAAAVKATLTIIAEEHLLERARTLESALRSALGPVPGVVAIRGAGVWLGVVIDRPAKPVAAALLERGFVVGCAADPYVLRLSPPAVLPLFVPAMLAEQLATLLGD